MIGVKLRGSKDPWLVRHERILRQHEKERRVIVKLSPEQPHLENQLKEMQKAMRRKKHKWESEYWEGIIEESVEASSGGHRGAMYRVLKDMGKRHSLALKGIHQIHPRTV